MIMCLSYALSTTDALSTLNLFIYAYERERERGGGGGKGGSIGGQRWVERRKREKEREREREKTEKKCEEVTYQKPSATQLIRRTPIYSANASSMGESDRSRPIHTDQPSPNAEL